MREIRKRLSEPFLKQSQKQEEQLDNAAENLEQYNETVQQWPVRKRKLYHYIIDTLEKWADALDKATIFVNFKPFKKVKRKLNRSKYMTIYSWGGFRKKLHLFTIRSINILRMLIIVSFYIGALFFTVYLIIKVFEAIRG